MDCEYKRPTWWTNNDTRRKQKDLIKSIIKRTKTDEKRAGQDGRPPLKHSQSMPTYLEEYGRTKRASSDDSDDYEDDNIDPIFNGTPGYYDPHAQQYYQSDIYAHGYTYEIDVKTERQMYVNDIPTRRDSSISTFSTFVPPTPHAMLPSFTGEGYPPQHVADDYSVPQPEWSLTNTTMESPLDFNLFDFSNGSSAPTQIPAETHTTNIEVDDVDRPLLDHLIDHVLPLVFPILEVNQRGSVKSDVILPALESNKAYLHCCLSHAAIHKRCFQESQQADGDAFRHKFAFVQEVVSALGDDVNHAQVLEATLGMISLQCVTGHADDLEKDIPWHQHFQAAVELVRKLGLPTMLEQLPPLAGRPPFNMTLTAWIDILGATMLGRAPIFADTYRHRHLSPGSTGLTELMGCGDNVMYLLSEVACLDALRLEKRLDDIGVCSHVQSLGRQLDATENPDEVVQHPYSSTGAFRPRQLSRNITAIFRKALRLYLCSLVPGFDRYGTAALNLVAQIASMMAYIPSGPDGFDRSLVWPLLLAGASSTPASTFRRVLAERVEALGSAAHTGNFGRLIRLLHECWRLNDEVAISAGVCEATPVTTGGMSPNGQIELQAVTVAGGVVAGTLSKPRGDIHWRDVMKENCWDFLLI